VKSLEIVIAGFGGQGILSAGRLVAAAGLIEGNEVSWLPSYGPEMRGGTANCSVILSDEPIGSPVLNECDCLIALNVPSLEKFEPMVRPGGWVILDRTLVPEGPTRTDVHLIAIEASRTASEMGNMTFAGVILLGALCAATNGFCRPSFEKALVEILPKSKHFLIPEEMEAFDLGRKFLDL
jgi:2-oxoglutarate ferredoxin oxidoreductase subunit gamma